jgi:glycine/D-amino acid oxidase-like deaminating enzyme/nitrite reductase/ring-hydroxylating ferredoxin subunit
VGLRAITLRKKDDFTNMKTHSGKSISVWMTTEKTVPTPALSENISVDVCIVGAGLGGLTTAYMLVREGKSVVVLEDGVIGGGQTGRTTAHFTNALDDRYFHIEHLHGLEGSRIAAESHRIAIDTVESIVNQEMIECDMERVDGYLFVPPGDSTDILDKELEACHRAGLKEVDLVGRSPISSFDTGPCLMFPRQLQLHPAKYLNGLAKAILRGGGMIFTGTHVDRVTGSTPAEVHTNHGLTVTAKSVVMATNTPVNDLVTMHTKQAPYRTYVIGARVPYGSVAKGLYWDTSDPYHYVRTQTIRNAAEGQYDLLIVGGEDHKTGQDNHPENHYAALEKWTKARFPMVQTIDYRWSGQVMEPVDAMGFIGRNPGDSPHIYIITGDSGNGMTHTTIGGILITDLIMSRPNQWAKLYDPSRKSLLAAPEFTKENVNVAVQYADHVRGGDVDSAAQITPGEGAVIRQGMKKIAVYRDEAGNIHRLSAVCSHLGCIVHWNGAEKSWDCPCHGSRFDTKGHVITGPAIMGLKHIDAERPAPSKAPPISLEADVPRPGI